MQKTEILPTKQEKVQILLKKYQKIYLCSLQVFSEIIYNFKKSFLSALFGMKAELEPDIRW